MRVLSLYDGMSCGYIALKSIGITPSRYVAYENDKYAITLSSDNFPDIEQKGVIDKTTDFSIYDGFDFVMGGSPCTYWSIAQSPNKREVVSSGVGWELFQYYVKAVNEAKPKYFIYENNKSMSKDIRKAIDEAFGFEAILINSALVSAQKRERLYWVGRRTSDGGYEKVHITQPSDSGITLDSILDDKNGVVLDSHLNGVPIGHVRTKSHTITARHGRGFTKFRGYNVVVSPYDIGNNIGLHSPHKIYKVVDGRCFLCGENGDFSPVDLSDGFYTARKLSLNECALLQTIPDWYSFNSVSKTQGYKCIGNGWTVDVISHLINACIKENNDLE